MCGIAGFVGLGGHADIKAMTDRLAHRGPDGAGFYTDEAHRVYFGHRRLSIIDIACGAQPMATQDGSCVVTYNGEIYNHRELRRELEGLGHRFVTDHSDTEVLLHGWREWGVDLPVRLNGMFAFGLWDKSRKQLFLARDRFGEKPLYWARSGDLFAFGSELSALQGHSRFETQVNVEAVKKLFAYGFIPSPLSLYRGVEKLPGGMWLLLETETGRSRSERYWQFSVEAQEDCNEAAAIEELRDLLRQSVRRRMMSDVPLGVFLSGGVDSSMVAAFAKSGAQGPVESFAIGFNEPSFDESGYARAAAAAIGTVHHERVLSLDVARELTPRILRKLDEPLGDPSLLPTYLLCQFARERVTVALSGDGGDELFAGYDTFSALRPAKIYEALIGGGLVHRGLVRLADLLPRSAANMGLDYKIQRALAGLGHGARLWNPRWLAPLPPGEIGELLQQPVDIMELYDEAISLWDRSAGQNDIDRSLEYYTRFYLQDNILTKVDRAAMMNGLEARSVFLDNDLVDFARRLPSRMKIRDGQRKYLLKKALAGIVPSFVLERPKKGFGIPLSEWLGKIDLPDRLPINDGHDIDIGGLKARHFGSRRDYRLALWCGAVLAAHQPSSKPL